MTPSNNNEIESVIAANEEEWKRLVFLLSNPEGYSVLWVNCDTYFIKTALHTALSQQLPHLQLLDIHINSHTTSLYQAIQDNNHRIAPKHIIHIFGIEEAAKSELFLQNLNFQRDSLFRTIPAHIIIWGNFATTALLSHSTYDFWSWMSLTFDFSTPQALLTSRQQSLKNTIQLSEKEIHIPIKDGTERIRHLQHEWDEFLRTSTPNTNSKQQMKDAIIIAQALAKEYVDEGKYKEAIIVLNNLLHQYPHLIEEESSAYVLNNLSMLHRVVGELKEAEECSFNALKLIAKGGFSNNLSVASIQSNLALVYMEMNQYDKAKELLKNAYNFYTQHSNSNYNNELLSVKACLAAVYTYTKEYHKAKELLEEVLNTSKLRWGANHHSIANYLSNLSTIYSSLGDIYKAKELALEALNIDSINYGENHPVTAIRYYNIAHIYKETNDISNAIAYMQKAYDIFATYYDDNHPKTKAAAEFLNQLSNK